MSNRKFGEGSLRAFMRQGHKEIGQALPAFRDSVHVVEEPGAFNNPTSYEVSKQTGAVQTKEDTVHGKVDDIDTTMSLKDQLQNHYDIREMPDEIEADIEHQHDHEPDVEP